MRMTEAEYSALIHRQAIASYQAPKPSKYGNKKIEIDGIWFSSKKEGSRYRQLKIMEAAGQITDLQLQHSFELAPAVIIGGKKKPALRYVSDFTYLREGVHVVEDTKGFLTDVYKIKRHLMKTVLNIEIEEV